MKIMRTGSSRELLEEATRVLATAPELQDGLRITTEYTDGRVSTWPFNDFAYAMPSRVFGFVKTANLDNVKSIEFMGRPHEND